MRRRGPLLRRRPRRCPSERRRSAGCARHARRFAGPLGSRRLRLLRRGDGDLAIRQGGIARSQGGLRQAPYPQARGERRPVHFPGHDAAPGAQRHPRLHRRRAPIHRRPFPADQDSGGPARRHSRMHRLQYLLQLQLPRCRDSLHSEPHDGRGMAPRLASGTRHRGRRQLGADRRRRPGGPRSRPHLGKRGFAVTLADAAGEPGGRVTLESRLPGLAEWPVCANTVSARSTRCRGCRCTSAAR